MEEEAADPMPRPPSGDSPAPLPNKPWDEGEEDERQWRGKGDCTYVIVELVPYTLPHPAPLSLTPHGQWDLFPPIRGTLSTNDGKTGQPSISLLSFLLLSFYL